MCVKLEAIIKHSPKMWFVRGKKIGTKANDVVID